MARSGINHVRVAWLGLVPLLLGGCAWVSRVDVDGVGPNGSAAPSLSADGRYVAFQAVVNPTTLDYDVLVHDRVTGAVDRVSVKASDAIGGSSQRPSISADSRYIAFDSFAPNLVAGDNNDDYDAFVHDRRTGTTTLVSVDSEGTQGNGASGDVSISGDGRYIAFDSAASNLVPGDVNSVPDVFVHDRMTSATTLVSVDDAGGQGDTDSVLPSISADGRFVVFESHATNLVAGHTGFTKDVFLHDRKTGRTTLVSVDGHGRQANGTSANASISADGRFIAFESDASNLVPGDSNQAVDVFVHDRKTGATERVSIDSAGVPGNNDSEGASLSADGRYVVFDSDASNLVAGDTNNVKDVFLHDRRTGRTSRVSVSDTGAQTNRGSDGQAISDDGNYVAFSSEASNLVPGDVNPRRDVFVRFSVVPTVGGVHPSSVPPGSSARVTITGTGFRSSAAVSFGPGTTVTSVKVLDETRVRVTVAVAPDAARGSRNVQVTNVGAFGPRSGSTNVCFGCFTV
jgi:Tol biopolymer transport system component